MKAKNNLTGEKKGGKLLTGKVIAIKMAKTVSVAVDHLWRHPIYKKAVHRTKRFLVHNDKLELTPGDQVLIQEIRPLSKRKYFKVMRKII